MARSSLTTLCYVEQDGKYLMMHRIKKKHDINKDKWVGIGGHFEEGESPEDCLLREAKEETGLTLLSYRLRGIVTFLSDAWQTEYMFLYTADAFEGSLSDCREAIYLRLPDFAQDFYFRSRPEYRSLLQYDSYDPPGI